MITTGANYLTNGSVTIAERPGMSQLMIGLTTIGFGTPAPELVASLTSALVDKPGIVIADAVGSDIAGILLVLGVSTVIYPLRVTHDAMKRDIPITILVTAICLVMASDHLLTGGLSGSVIGRGDDIILFGFLIFYLYLAFMSVPREKTLEVDQPPLETKSAKPTVLLSTVRVIGGLTLLILGEHLSVDNASSIARSWGVSEVVIGLTIVATGTLLPELVTSVVVAVKRQPDLAIGNAVGSGILNTFFIPRASATITPLAPASIQLVDYMMMLVAASLLLIFSNVTGRVMISRKEGVALLIIYVTYMTYLIVETLQRVPLPEQNDTTKGLSQMRLNPLTHI